MSDASKIKDSEGQVVNVKDAQARADIASINSSLTNLEGRLISATITYNSTLGYFPIPSNLPVPASLQIALTVRNGATGALYVVWYDSDNRCFRIGETLSGNAPSNNNGIRVQYIATSS